MPIQSHCVKELPADQNGQWTTGYIIYYQLLADKLIIKVK